MPAALNGAIPSLQARHEKQRLLFFAVLLAQPHRWHCHEATRASLSFIGIPRRIVRNQAEIQWSRDSREGRVRRFGMSTEEDLGKDSTTSSNRRAYTRSIWYNQKTTPCIEWRESQRETQLSVGAVEPSSHCHCFLSVQAEELIGC